MSKAFLQSRKKKGEKTSFPQNICLHLTKGQRAGCLVETTRSPLNRSCHFSVCLSQTEKANRRSKHTETKRVEARRLKMVDIRDGRAGLTGSLEGYSYLKEKSKVIMERQRERERNGGSVI